MVSARLLAVGSDRAGEIAALHRLLFDPGWGEAAIRGLLARPGSLSFVAEVPGTAGLAGFVLAQVAADEAEILSLGVAPCSRRAGLGRRLTETLIEALRELSAQRLFLEVASDNAPALAWYRKLGFEPVGARKSYYACGGDAVVLALTL
jgi:ribosomal-protein-alanine N-acetyltransferase